MVKKLEINNVKQLTAIILKSLSEPVNPLLLSLFLRRHFDYYDHWYIYI